MVISTDSNLINFFSEKVKPQEKREAINDSTIELSNKMLSMNSLRALSLSCVFETKRFFMFKFALLFRNYLT